MGAIDSVFLTRLFVGMMIYWAVWILTKGIFEPLQAHIGKQAIFLGHQKTKELRYHADRTASKIDDFFADRLGDGADILNGIVSGDDLSPQDKREFRRILAERYQLDLLLEKLGVED